MTFEELARRPSRELEALLRQSQAPSSEALAGFEFRGWNTPAYCSVLGIRKFVKGFFAGAAGLEGFNIPVAQNGLGGPWRRKPSEDAPKRFGFYRVVQAGPGSPYPDALLLDYGASARNPALAPERLLRDYLVVPDPTRPDLLLGKAYLALGARAAVSFFVLERLRESSWRPT